MGTSKFIRFSGNTDGVPTEEIREVFAQSAGQALTRALRDPRVALPAIGRRQAVAVVLVQRLGSGVSGSEVAVEVTALSEKYGPQEGAQGVSGGVV